MTDEKIKTDDEFNFLVALLTRDFFVRSWSHYWKEGANGPCYAIQCLWWHKFAKAEPLRSHLLDHTDGFEFDPETETYFAERYQ